MGKTTWPKLGTVAPGELTRARVMAHHAAQWATRAARAGIDPAPDDSHSNLGWEADHGALTSHAIGTGRLGLRIADMTLVRIGSDRVEDAFALDGKTDLDAGQWVGDALQALGREASARAITLPYELPPHDVAAGGVYDISADAPALEELAAWFAAAHDVLGNIATDLRDVRPGPSPVRCWPHHFDIATLVSLEAGDPETARAIGVGLSPGDETYDQPYFYVNPWPALATTDLPDLPAPGRWHVEGFVGAIAQGDDLIGLDDQRAGMLTFLRGAVAASRARLGLG